VTYVKKITEDYTVDGDIEGILLTGLTKEGVQLFEEYVDRTGDVQTPTLVLSQVIPKEFKDKRAEKWLEMFDSPLFLKGFVWCSSKQTHTFRIVIGISLTTGSFGTKGPISILLVKNCQSEFFPGILKSVELNFRVLCV